ncbi:MULTISPECIES: hypothetical protein [Bacillus]|uniref:hypothetical protein n=1 Tax=Bacillus TaxID=1386 RepID=UPI000422EFBC|nr:MULTISPECIES: hypothetical protein [Bacillus]QHZ48545.1 hypothetical protein M654_020940 [Bacillus sp. NSP9.1]WFA05819.1 hypothetical protein P3X63_02950 [Bacillus sp. HSf4]
MAKPPEQITSENWWNQNDDDITEQSMCKGIGVEKHLQGWEKENWLRRLNGLGLEGWQTAPD